MTSNDVCFISVFSLFCSCLFSSCFVFVVFNKILWASLISLMKSMLPDRWKKYATKISRQTVKRASMFTFSNLLFLVFILVCWLKFKSVHVPVSFLFCVPTRVNPSSFKFVFVTSTPTKRVAVFCFVFFSRFARSFLIFMFWSLHVR